VNKIISSHQASFTTEIQSWFTEIEFVKWNFTCFAAI